MKIFYKNGKRISRLEVREIMDKKMSSTKIKNKDEFKIMNEFKNMTEEQYTKLDNNVTYKIFKKKDK